jgi:hypothetical protein
MEVIGHGDSKLPNPRVLGMCNFLGVKIQGPADRKFHIGLAAQKPDIAQTNISDQEFFRTPPDAQFKRTPGGHGRQLDFPGSP